MATPRPPRAPLGLIGLAALVLASAAHAQTPLHARGHWEATGRDAAHVAVTADSLVVYDWVGDEVNLLAGCYAVTRYGGAVQTSPGVFLFRGQGGTFVVTGLDLVGGRLHTGELGLAEDLPLALAPSARSGADLRPLCAPADLVRPGLGPSNDAPAGSALHLPPGVTIAGEIRAANWDGSCDGGRRTAPTQGGGGVCVCIPLRNDTDSTVTIVPWDEGRGGILISRFQDGQNPLLVERVRISVPPQSSVDVPACGQCGNEDREPVAGGTPFSGALQSSDRAAAYLAGLVAGKAVSEEAARALQTAVWDLTDGRGLRAASRDALLAALQPDTDGDGAGDADEGSGDGDGDGTPDALDPDATRHGYRVPSTGESHHVLPRIGVAVRAVDERGGTLHVTRVPSSAVLPAAGLAEAGLSGAGALPWAYRFDYTEGAPEEVEACVSLYDRPAGADARALRLYVRAAPGRPWAEVPAELYPSDDDPDNLCAGSLPSLGLFVVATAPPVVAAEDAPDDSAAPLALLAPTPNPTRGRAELSLALREAGPVTVEVLDALGRRVATLHDGPLASGTHTLALDAKALPPGTYSARATAGAAAATRRFTVAR